MIRWLGVVQKGAASSILSVDQVLESETILDGLGNLFTMGFH